MRLLASFLAMAAAGASCGAAQAQGCPTRITPQIESGFGREGAVLSQGVRSYVPRRLFILGERVPYVVVERGEAGDADAGKVTRVSYRLGGQRRAIGQPLPGDLYAAYAAAYPQTRCTGPDAGMCDAWLDDVPDWAGGLSSASIGYDDLFLSDDSRGPGLATLRRDTDVDETDPLYLICDYEAAGR